VAVEGHGRRGAGCPVSCLLDSGERLAVVSALRLDDR
jgi:hypothetical protein